MPTVSADQVRFFSALDIPGLSIEKFSEMCFDFGVELDDVTSEQQQAQKEHEGRVNATSARLSDRTILKIDVSANRYDLMCEEGLARAFRVFLGKEKNPRFTSILPTNPITITVKKECAQIRPFIVGAVLRGIKFQPHSYNSFIELQEKLHQGLCRRRTLVAIGTHDLDSVTAPFSYEALPPSSIHFVPLNQTQDMDGHQLMDFYAADKRLSKFLPIIRDSPVFPVLYDSKRTTLSLPPIINGNHSKIHLHTTNVFIECTATDASKANTVLNIMVTMFSQYCATPFSVEQVVVDYGHRSQVTPNLKSSVMDASVDYINSCIGTGVSLSAVEIVSMLERMGLPSTSNPTSTVIHAHVPPNRSDVLHACDVMEDVAVAFGINRIPKTLPAIATIARAFPLNKLSDMLRLEVAQAGWTEILCLTLCSEKENFDYLKRRVDDPRHLAVYLMNPKTAEYEVVRTSLATGLLKTAASNKSTPLPLQLFEVGDVVLRDAENDRGARNERRLAALYCGKTSGFEFVHGLLDRIMAMCDVARNDKNASIEQSGESSESTSNKSTKSNTELQYAILPSNISMFFSGRQAEVMLNGRVVGQYGIIHPDCLAAYDVAYPCSFLELNIEPFL